VTVNIRASASPLHFLSAKWRSLAKGIFSNLFLVSESIQTEPFPKFVEPRIDELVKSQETPSCGIPAKATTQGYQGLLDPGEPQI
jgi:hypothetical protein